MLREILQRPPGPPRGGPTGRLCARLLLGLLLVPGAGSAAPRVTLEHGTVDLVWRDGGEGDPGQATVTAVLQKPVIRVQQSRAPEEEAAGKKTTPPPGTGEALREAAPLPLDVPRVEIHRGVLSWSAAGAGPDVRFSEVEAVLENLGTHARFAEGRPTLVTAAGRVGEQGEAALFVTTDPVSPGLDLAGRAQVSNLRLADLQSLIGGPEGLKLSEGTLNVFAEFSVRDGRLDGAVKVVLEGAEITSEDAGLITDAVAWLADEAVEFASDRVPRRQALATVVPLEGRISDPEIGLFRAVVAVVRNAFFEALTAGFQSLATGGAGT